VQLKTIAMSATTAVVLGLTLTACSGGGGGSSESKGGGDTKPVSGSAVKVDLTKEAETKAGITLTDTQLGDRVQVKQISTKLKTDNVKSLKTSEGDVVLVQLKVTVPEDGYSVSASDFGLTDDQDTTSSDLYAGGLEAAMEAQGYSALPSYVETGSTKTGWVPLQLLDTAKSADLTWKREKHTDYESNKKYPARTMSAPLLKNTGADSAVTAAKEGATPKQASAKSTDDVTKNTVTVDQIITNFPLPAAVDYESGHIVAVHVKADAGSVYTSGWSPSDLQLLTADGDKLDRYSNPDVATALAEKGFPGLTDDGYISSGESTTGWVPFLVKPSTGDSGFTISQHRRAANIIGGGSVPAADFPAKIAIRGESGDGSSDSDDQTSDDSEDSGSNA
jgi:hypothetical protein